MSQFGVPYHLVFLDSNRRQVILGLRPELLLYMKVSDTLDLKEIKTKSYGRTVLVAAIVRLITSVDFFL